MKIETLQNEFLSVSVSPEMGGKIISLKNIETGREFIHFDAELAEKFFTSPHNDYDSLFCGGIDELLPSDIPENVDGVDYPDHGELWTTECQSSCDGKSMKNSAQLPVSQLFWERELVLEGRTLVSRFRITNKSCEKRNFLWKPHAAMKAEKGDILRVPASCMVAADPDDWSKAKDALPHRWNGELTVPEMDGTSDFFYLTDLSAGQAEWICADGAHLRCTFDTSVFPAFWVFASFGKLNGSRTVILEPCTNYPVAIADAVKARCCGMLNPGETLESEISWEVLK